MLVHVKCSKLCQVAGKHLAINNSSDNNSSVSYYPKKGTKKYSAHIYDLFCHYFPLSSQGNKMYGQSVTVHIMYVSGLFSSTYLLQATTDAVKGFFLSFLYQSSADWYIGKLDI